MQNILCKGKLTVPFKKIIIKSYFTCVERCLLWCYVVVRVF